jgi:hypothetical protein
MAPFVCWERMYCRGVVVLFSLFWCVGMDVIWQLRVDVGIVSFGGPTDSGSTGSHFKARQPTSVSFSIFDLEDYDK